MILIGRPSNFALIYSSLGLASGTEVSGHGLTYLVDPSNPARMFWATDTTALRITWDHGSAITLEGIALSKHNLDVNLDVRLQRNATNSWVTPSVDVSLPIAADHEDGHSTSPWCDLRGTTAYRYTSLYVPVNSVAPRLSGVVLVKQWSTLEVDFDFGVSYGESRPFIESLRTEADVRRMYRRRLKTRYLQADFKPTATDLAFWKALAREVDAYNLPLVWVQDSSVKTDNALLVTYSDEALDQFEYVDDFQDSRERKQYTLGLREVSRGLPL